MAGEVEIQTFLHSSNFIPSRQERALLPPQAICLTLACHAEKPTAQIAHLVFAETRANAEKTKRAIFLPTLTICIIFNVNTIT